MASQVISSVENNFTKGLITESTGLNFPENAATSTENCTYSLVGDVTRREGIGLEDNYSVNIVDRTNKAMSTYVWNNVGGDGLTKFLVKQIGSTLYFYRTSTASVQAPVSNQLIGSTISVSSFTSLNGVFNQTLECQYSDGNGYLFVFHPNCDPFFVTYSSTTGQLIAQVINIQIRDFSGIYEATNVNIRPFSTTSEHTYNLQNQGWTTNNTWQGISSTIIAPSTGVLTFVMQTNQPVVTGTVVSIVNGIDVFPGGNRVPANTIILSGNVTAYNISTGSITINCTYYSGILGNPSTPIGSWVINPVNFGYINTWVTQLGNYPSNADVWWYFKDNAGVYNPLTTNTNVNLNTGQAPQGHYILSAFNQNRGLVSGLPNITPVVTTVRPRTGTWFQGRVWYAGVEAQQVAQGDAQFYTWTENIYFSQVTVNSTDFGNCYQTNDPTGENLNGELPTDGGVIQIQGAGSIYKLFPIANGLLVFASNGVWFITGSAGIGFAANDYTITKISNVQSISGSSFVNVLGLPYFWNIEGIYKVSPSNQNGSLTVEPITVGTILSYYSDIPNSSKSQVRGDYDPINYVIQWCFRSTQESDVTSRYQFDTILNYNTYNHAFFPYTISADNNHSFIHGINYVLYSLVTTNTPDPTFKYHCSFSVNGGYNHSFAEENDTTFVDWGSANYVSFFITGYKLHGQGQKRSSIPYVYVFSKGPEQTAYKIQGTWDYATSGNSARWSTAQYVLNQFNDNYSVRFRRHRIRGMGLALQFKLTSVDGQPFDIIGWSLYENVNTGV